MDICKALEKVQPLKEKILLLRQLITHLEITEAPLQNVTSRDENVLRILEAVVTPGLVKSFIDSEERDYDESDFEHVAEAAEESFTCVRLLLSKLNVAQLKSRKLFFVLILKLCATHSKKFVWSSAKVVSLSQEVLDLLLKVTGIISLGDLLCISDDHPNDILKSILLSLRETLSKETWTQNPSVCHIFQWLLHNVKHPYLSDHLSEVLPPSLMFIDHHTNEKKVLGIKCLHHIIDNVPAAELKMYGRADVVYDVLHRLIYVNEPDVIDVLYPCLLKFLSSQERDPHTAGLPRKWGRYDDIYHQLMLNLHIEERVILCRAYSRHIPAFIDKMGITIVKHLKSTDPFIVKYLAVYDGPEEESRINSLLALRSLIRVAWPRMEHHMEEYLKRLIFLMYDIEVGSGTNVDKVKYQILELCKECLLLLKRACPVKFQDLTSEVINLQNIPGIDILEAVCSYED